MLLDRLEHAGRGAVRASVRQADGMERAAAARRSALAILAPAVHQINKTLVVKLVVELVVGF